LSWWLRGAAITEIDSIPLRGGRQLIAGPVALRTASVQRIRWDSKPGGTPHEDSYGQWYEFTALGRLGNIINGLAFPHCSWQCVGTTHRSARKPMGRPTSLFHWVPGVLLPPAPLFFLPHAPPTAQSGFHRAHLHPPPAPPLLAGGLVLSPPLTPLIG